MEEEKEKIPISKRLLDLIPQKAQSKVNNISKKKSALIPWKTIDKIKSIKTDNKKKIAICEKLGAERFQGVVFKAEDIKYKVLKTVFPNFIKHYDRVCNYKRDKQLKKLHSDTSKKEVIEKYRLQKLLMRKEIAREQNRNYHMDQNKPTEFIQYLNWNKDIHKRGLKKDAITIPILGIVALCGFTPAIPLLIAEVGSAFINFQCINIQNYNIYRFKESEDILKKMETKRQERNIKNYSQGAKVIEKSLNETKEIPSMDDIINNIENKEQLVELRNMVLRAATENRKIQEAKEVKVKAKGGRK